MSHADQAGFIRGRPSDAIQVGNAEPIKTVNGWRCVFQGRDLESVLGYVIVPVQLAT